MHFEERSMRAFAGNLALTAVLVLAALTFASVALAAGKGAGTSAGSTAGATGKGQPTASTASTASRPGSMQSPRPGGSGAMGGTYYRNAPELDPTRKISEQDCTKPLAQDGGNLRCK